MKSGGFASCLFCMLTLISLLPVFTSNVFNYVPQNESDCNSQLHLLFPVSFWAIYVDCQVFSTLFFFSPLRHHYLSWDSVNSYPAGRLAGLAWWALSDLLFFYSRLRFSFFLSVLMIVTYMIGCCVKVGTLMLKTSACMLSFVDNAIEYWATEPHFSYCSCAYSMTSFLP